jgi:hypothetical protein
MGLSVSLLYVLLQTNLIIAPAAKRSNVIGRTSAGDRRTPIGEILELSFNIQGSERASRAGYDAVREQKSDVLGEWSANSGRTDLLYQVEC